MEGKILAMNYNEGQYMLDPSCTVQSLEGNELNVTLHGMFKYSMSLENVGLQLTVRFQLAGREILTFGMVLSVVIEGWKVFVGGSPSEDEIRSFTRHAWGIVIGYARGVLGERLRGTAFHGLFVPDVNMDSFLPTIKVKNVVV